MALLASPYVGAGAAAPVARAYTHAVDYYPLRTAEAYNGWYLLDRFDIAVRGLPAREARRDDRPALGPLTWRDLGLVALAAYLFYVLAVLWRRPSLHGLVLAAAMSYFAFFMLPTQVHQRYLVPAVALVGLAAARARWALALFVALGVTATLNQGLDLARAVLDHSVTTGASSLAPPVYRGPIRLAASVVSVLNVAAFAWATVTFKREMATTAQ